MSYPHPPYPQPPYGAPPRRALPASPRTLGVLSIVFGSIVSLFSFIGMFGQGAFSGMGGQAYGHAAWERFQDQIRVPSAVQALVFLAMSIALIVIGTGQRRYRRWAAGASVAWGWTGLAVLVGVLVVHFTILGPAQAELFEHLPRGAREIGGIAKLGGILSAIFYAPYPIILIATFRKPGVVAAMTT